MFSWLNKILGKEPARKVPPPPQANSPSENASPSGNPGKGSEFRLAVTGPAGQREEHIDLLQALRGVFQRRERVCSISDPTLRDTTSGFEFRPGIVSFQPNDDLSMQTCTTIEIRHPTAFPHPFFEYQHSVGPTGEQAVIQGFEQWAEVDLPVLLDALEARPQKCMMIEIPLPGGKARRVVLGPVTWWAPSAGAPSQNEDGKEAHPPFCACCMFTRSYEIFKSLVESDGHYAIRFYATRDNEGHPQADCRVNGEDYADGQHALIAYAQSWTSVGFEARKQYALIQDQPLATDSNS